MTRNLQQKFEDNGIQYHLIKGGKALDVSFDDMGGESIFTFWPIDRKMFSVDFMHVPYEEEGNVFHKGIYLGNANEMVDFIRGEENKSGMTEQKMKLRAIIRERLMKGLEESDALYAKSESWKDAARKLKSELVTLLKNIEDDNYESGLKTIDDVMLKLKMWKAKIQKYLG